MNAERPEDVVEEDLEQAGAESGEEAASETADADAGDALAAAEAKAKENWDRYLRTAAEL